MKVCNKIWMRRLAAVTALYLCVSALFCANRTNPFIDYSNARAFLSRVSFSDGDNLSIFTRDTFDVAVAVSGLVDSICLHVDNNRLFGADTVLYPGAADFLPVIYRFVISMYDTGEAGIFLTTYLSSGKSHTEEWNVYATGTSGQPPVTGAFEEPVTLSAEKAGDDDVLYWWDFNVGPAIMSPKNDTGVIINDASYGGTGLFWMTDFWGRYRSPEMPFEYVFIDTTGPLIECANTGFERENEVLAGQDDFLFIVKITDRNRGGVADVRINGESVSTATDPFYSRLFQMNGQTGQCITVTVQATDNFEDGNISVEEFSICFDSLAEHGGVSLSIINPPADSFGSMTRDFALFGLVENQTGDSVVLMTCVNSNVCAAETLSTALTEYWAKQVYLDRDANMLRILIADMDGIPLDSTSFTVLFDSAGIDTSPPVIYEISYDGQPGHNAYVDDDTALIHIVAFDQGSGMASITVDGVLYDASGFSAGFACDAAFAVFHGREGNRLNVSAVDRNNIKKDTSVIIYHNMPPVVDDLPNPASYIVAGEWYIDTVKARDPDGDQLFFVKHNSPQSMIVDSFGIVSWKPGVSDIGIRNAGVIVKDGIASVSINWQLTVVDSAIYGNGVRFMIGEQDFPAYLETGRDTARVFLAIAGGSETVTGPFQFNAVRRLEPVNQIIDVQDSVFEWLPQNVDTGYQHFVITVHDRYDRADTLYPVVLVVPPNRPCTLSYSSKCSVLPDGELDMTAGTEPETLSIYIEDADLLLVERYDVNVNFAGTKDTRTIEGADSFSVVIDPGSAQSDADTLSVDIEDRGGFADTLIVPVRFH
jgi:hypothetical protein